MMLSVMSAQIKIFSLFLLDVLKIMIVAIAIVLPIRYFLFQPFVVKGASMEPNYHSGDYLIIDEISYRFNEPERGDVIVFKYPYNLSDRYIKRVIGLPGETVEIKEGQIYISKEGGVSIINESSYLPEKFIKEWKNLDDLAPITLKENQYFVLGDNRNASSDSRRWGTLPEENIIGKSALQFSLPEFLSLLLSLGY
ncbi:MAG: signal peptidase I [Candidatus Paceibacterota bacterium]|nr:signal peptidase I [Candidatus Paceibacterota bacterium]